jgi:S1-C subfamily serine protease
MGTAFAIKAPNLVATAGHVVAGKNLKGARLMSSVFQRRSFRFRKVAEDSDADLALLRLEDTDPDFSPLEIATTPTTYGQRVWAMGYPTTHYGPQQIQLEQSDSHLAVCPCAIVPGPLPDTATRDLVFFVKPKLNLGMSGSPILDQANQVVGVLVSVIRREKRGQLWDTNLSMCVCSIHLAQLLRRVETEPELEPEAAPAKNRRRWLRFFHWR